MGLHLADTQRTRAEDIEIAYRVYGQGQPLLLIAGLGAVKELWNAEFIDGLASKFKVIAYDNRGMGETSMVWRELEISRFSEDAANLLDSIDASPAHVLGYSMGGYIAQELALGHPELVDRLVLLGTECGGAHGIRVEPGILLQMTGVRDGERNFLISSEQLENDGSSIGDLFGTLDSRQDAERLRLQADAIKSWSGTCARLPEMDKPTLVITGSDDIVILPENAKVLSELIPGSSLVELEGGHHGLLLQYPAELARIVAEFLSG